MTSNDSTSATATICVREASSKPGVALTLADSESEASFVLGDFLCRQQKKVKARAPTAARLPMTPPTIEATGSEGVADAA